MQGKNGKTSFFSHAEIAEIYFFTQKSLNTLNTLKLTAEKLGSLCAS